MMKTDQTRTEARAERIQGVRPAYLEALTLVERLHRCLLDVVKDEFDRRGSTDLNAVQALLIYNIGDSELTAGELRTRGYYLGSNVSYNVKKLVEMGYLHHARSRVDRRSVRISLTEKGRELGLVDDRRWTAFEIKREAIEREEQRHGEEAGKQHGFFQARIETCRSRCTKGKSM